MKIAIPIGIWIWTGLRVKWFPNYYILDSMSVEEQIEHNKRNGIKMDYETPRARLYRDD